MNWKRVICLFTGHKEDIGRFERTGEMSLYCKTCGKKLDSLLGIGIGGEKNKS